ncbi:MAG: hypothetical protein J07HX5_01658 [halophilic archaeon J07HX5]|nr:MAG: hypothetical protein J07HX5_01658 [halophilic archaeon J07HX5]
MIVPVDSHGVVGDVLDPRLQVNGVSMDPTDGSPVVTGHGGRGRYASAGSSILDGFGGLSRVSVSRRSPEPEVENYPVLSHARQPIGYYFPTTVLGLWGG